MAENNQVKGQSEEPRVSFDSAKIAEKERVEQFTNIAGEKERQVAAERAKKEAEKKRQAARDVKTITIAGDFNSWSSTANPLKQGKDGSFSVTIELEKGKEYQFRYLLDGKRWENDWAADKYIPAPFSHTDNSVVIC